MHVLDAAFLANLMTLPGETIGGDGVLSPRPGWPRDRRHYDELCAMVRDATATPPGIRKMSLFGRLSRRLTGGEPPTPRNVALQGAGAGLPRPAPFSCEQAGHVLHRAGDGL